MFHKRGMNNVHCSPTEDWSGEVALLSNYLDSI